MPHPTIPSLERIGHNLPVRGVTENPERNFERAFVAGFGMEQPGIKGGYNDQPDECRVEPEASPQEESRHGYAVCGELFFQQDGRDQETTQGEKNVDPQKSSGEPRPFEVNGQYGENRDTPKAIETELTSKSTKRGTNGGHRNYWSGCLREKVGVAKKRLFEIVVKLEENSREKFRLIAKMVVLHELMRVELFKKLI